MRANDIPHFTEKKVQNSSALYDWKKKKILLNLELLPYFLIFFRIHVFVLKECLTEIEVSIRKWNISQIDNGKMSPGGEKKSYIFQ